jgi:radical SAM superfamily enzyme YgiQ (UPF0313 family)
MNHALLIGTYELGRQPFGLASPAAWLRRAGAPVTCVDLAVAQLDRAAVARAALIGLYVPMHTATRLSADLLPKLRKRNPQALIVCYGLYAPLNADLLLACGADAVVGGEFEAALVEFWQRAAAGSTAPQQPSETIRLERLDFLPPDRSDLPPLNAYATLITADGERIVGATEASRGCKHTCRHCPVVPVYGGRFRVVPRAVVLADIRQQVAAGAQHITFGDPDFFNGPGHALPLVRALHAEFPELTYDVTIKVEHLLRHAELLPELRATGCVLITSAIEALDDAILERFAKQHTRADVVRAAELLRRVGISLNATFVAFTPWTSRAVYRQFLDDLATLDLIESVSPIQYAIRLLIPTGSWLLERADVQALVQPFDPQALAYPWQHPDPAMDQLQIALQRLAQGSTARGETRLQFYQQVCDLVDVHLGSSPRPALTHWLPRPPIPYLSEPWYC